jgi:hypothetical protein
MSPLGAPDLDLLEFSDSRLGNTVIQYVSKEPVLNIHEVMIAL